MGPLASHMVLHILLMNLVAPLAAMCLSHTWRERPEPAPGMLQLATIAQLIVLWAWHAPPLLNRALTSQPVHLLMYASLLLSAFLFWWAVLRFDADRRWKPIVALLVTSKLYCLLAVLFVFSPRALYSGIAGSHAGHGASVFDTTLADQQLAGLIMLAACPATYVLAGIALAGRWLLAMDAEAANPAPTRPNTGEEAWS
ncbi:cytochrome c oxidase assembly protein [Sinorhizobium numidicum]|uniref:Cytochrome c oxidase assembly protein n=1 Tax=Sinorhizobium numidicum TaxID=680248 RepID=A0ABY8CR91_9HYPH|nr:cytochrome c oxidase assembly protein [Sinorhizobium numidicum]WEX73967.1 cytochrome c oxidase assembly protein [Sinorhizobium numidicum]WEX79952.1 cytochrome c oxidase assembly protein [Sinorhizobium numidicum]